MYMMTSQILNFVDIPKTRQSKYRENETSLTLLFLTKKSIHDTLRVII